jgi:hypothetical protein
LTRGHTKGRHREEVVEYESDKDQIQEVYSSKQSSQEEEKQYLQPDYPPDNILSDIINGEFIEDDKDDFDYEGAKRDSKAEMLEYGRS